MWRILMIGRVSFQVPPCARESRVEGLLWCCLCRRSYVSCCRRGETWIVWLFIEMLRDADDDDVVVT